MARPPLTPSPALRRLMLREAESAGCTLAQILNGSQCSAVVRARRRIMFKMRERGFSAPLIGLYLGRHHSTVLYQLGCLTRRKPPGARMLAFQDAAPIPDLSGEWAI